MTLEIYDPKTRRVLATVLVRRASMNGSITTINEAQSTILRGKLVQYGVSYTSFAAFAATVHIMMDSTQLEFHLSDQ